MLTRFLKLVQPLDELAAKGVFSESSQVYQYLPPRGPERKKLEKLIAPMTWMEQVNKILQGEDCTFLQVRTLFDKAIRRWPIMTATLGVSASLADDHAFLDEICKVLNQEESLLSYEEKQALSRCTRNRIMAPEIEQESDAEASNLDESPGKLLSRKKPRLEKKSEYIDLASIPPTSNICERLFSASRLVLTAYRKFMSPRTFNSIMVLKLNRALWDGKTVQKALEGSRQQRRRKFSKSNRLLQAD